ncbi:nickel pincer cofactor biosynthesis protein LarB [Candidatus Micrarchaeota archaeon]|nr:nickel pincer cofactor biosynthesis protein LarB [Candidatus Micrarchaeota archaeon]
MLKVDGLKRIEQIARLDLSREVRGGVPEVLLAEGKTPEQVAKIAEGVEGGLLISRVGEEHLKAIRRKFGRVEYNKLARTVAVGKSKYSRKGTVGIITAGTSDIHAAEEAAVVAEMMGCRVMKAYDVGVAGLHRLFTPLKKMMGDEVDVIVVVAGREGTLPSIVAGMIDVPVIGVPTSSGYGFGGKGEAALKSMLQSCSFITVVNIDNGIGAGACAALIARRAHEH